MLCKKLAYTLIDVRKKFAYPLFHANMKVCKTSQHLTDLKINLKFPPLHTANFLKRIYNSFGYLCS